MENSNQISTYLSFKLGEELFATNVEKVLNILEYKKITKIPDAPAYMKGVINLRGKVLPVVDMRIKFGLPETENTVETSIIVLDIEMDGTRVDLGILVDSVCEVLEIDRTLIEPSPSIGTRYKAQFIEGLWRKEDKFIMLLHIDSIFSADEIISVENAQVMNNQVETVNI